MYDTCVIAIIVIIASIILAYAWAILKPVSMDGPGMSDFLWILPVSLALSALTFYGRLYWISSLRNYRGALVDASTIHAVGLMSAMASYHVSLKSMFRNLSRMGDVYGNDMALEASYVLSLMEEDGMDAISALRKAQVTSPGAIWQELLIGIAAVQSSCGNLGEYLQGRYEALSEKKARDVRKYNETAQGLSSVYLSIVGIAAIFVAIVDLVFNMAGLLSGDGLVWVDAFVLVPLGSFIVIKALYAASPEATP
jgi:flagellar protein FlaJ